MRRRMIYLLAILALLATGCLGCGFRHEQVAELRAVAEGAQLFPRWELVHGSLLIQSAAFSESGRVGWAIGPYGDLLRYSDEGQWRPVKVDDELSIYTAVWVASDGDVWLADKFKITRLQGRRLLTWRIPAFEVGITNLAGRTSTFVQGAQGAESLWVIRSDGTVFLFKDGEFELRSGSSSHLNLISVWLAPDGHNGWGIDSEGKLVSFSGTAWQYSSSSDKKALVRLHGLKFTRDGRYGVAVGDDGTLLEYQVGVWSPHNSIVGKRGETLRSVWLSSNGEQGWAVGDSGLILSLKDRKWQAEPNADARSDKNFVGVWGSPDASRVWVTERPGSIVLTLQNGHWDSVGGSVQLTQDRLVEVSCGKTPWALSAFGDLFYEEGGRWTIKSSLGAPVQTLSSTIWISSEGDQGWAIGGGGRIYRLRDGDWEIDPGARSLTDNPMHALAFSDDGNVGWAVGDGGTALHYEVGTWRVVQLTKDSMFAIWLSPDGRTGWVAYESGYLKLQHGRWEVDGSISYVSDMAVAGSKSDVVAWAAGQREVFRFERREWTRDQQASCGESYNGVWLSPDGSSGLMVTKRSALFLQRGTWVEDRQIGSLTNALLLSACMAQDLKSGWAVGDGGTILRYAPSRILGAELRSASGVSIESLSGKWILRFDHPVKRVSSLALVDEDRDTIQAVSKEEYVILPEADEPREFTLELKAAAKLAERFQGSEQRLQIEAEIQHPSMPIVAVFRTAAFTIEGRPIWQRPVNVALAILGGNVLLVFAATRVRWIRSLILHPTDSLAVNAIVSKLLVVDGLLRFVTPLKLAMFRDYRSRLWKSSVIAAWQGERRYIAPAISVNKMLDAEVPGDSASKQEEAWQITFRRLLNSPRRILWLIVGPSGLGKSALLENWFRLALEVGETPFLIRLRGSDSAVQEASSLMAQYGDIDVSPEFAFDLLKRGGFVLLLDGFNEDGQPDSTREFVRRVIQDNCVVMTSQFDPGWGQRVEVRRITLEPFGRTQLSQILGDARADEILRHPAMLEMAQLPFTALFLARYLRRHEAMPINELEVYRDVLEGLDRTGLRNLEESAWRLFKTNEADLRPDGRLSSQFLESAVECGVLTRSTHEGEEIYRFVHEKLHRILAALWLDRQDRRELKEWYADAQPSQGRIYWIDVLDYWGKLKAHRSIGVAVNLKDYIGFLTEVANFNLDVFARLYSHYDQLCIARILPADSEFSRLAARKLAAVVAPR